METWMYGIIGATSVIAVATIVAFLLYSVLLIRTYCVHRLIIKGNLQAKASTFTYYKGRGRIRNLTFNEVKKYSECFSNRVGNGTTNYVYKGILPDGTEVAVKKTKEEVAHSSDVEASFWFQVHLLSRVYHHHLVNLVGICNEKVYQMLVFQYASNGTLYEILHGEEHLSWKQRMRIAVGVASGLAYLHHSCDPPVIHGDLRSCHVFLTEDYAAKVGGLGKVPKAASSEVAVVRRTGGTVDPETVQKGVHSRAGDVYSFGVLLLELITGRLTFCLQDGLPLVDWVSGGGGEEAELVDRRLPAGNVVEAELNAVVELARLCVEREAGKRPSMRQAQEMLHKGLRVGPDACAPCTSPLTLRGLLQIS